MTGQHFGEELVTLINRPGFSYDSHWSSVACAAVELVCPERAFEFSRALQKAFFERGVDVTTPEGCTTVVQELGLPVAHVADQMSNDPALKRATASAATGQALQARAGANGVPTLAAEYEGRVLLLPHYEPQQALSLLQISLQRGGQLPVSQ